MMPPAPRRRFSPSHVGDTSRELDTLVTRVLEIHGEDALELAIARALWSIAHRPVDASLRHLIPARCRDAAVQIDASALRDAVTAELRRLVSPH